MGFVVPLRIRVMVLRSQPTFAANSASVSRASSRYALSLMRHFVHHTHRDCKPICACGLLFPTVDEGDTLCMTRHFLRAWRKNAGKTLEQVADHLHMSHSQLSRIETYKQPYNQELLEALAELYMCDVVDLLIRDPSDPEGMWTIWEHAKPAERRQIRDVAEALTRRAAT